MQRACKGKNRAGQPSNNPRMSRAVHRVEEGQELSTLDSPLYHVKSAEPSHSSPPPPPNPGQGEGGECIVRMEVDTGAPMSLMSEATFSGLWPGRVLQPSQVRLQSDSKESIPVVGSREVNINYQGQMARLPLLIVAGTGPTLMGRDWLSQIRVNWQKIHHAGQHCISSSSADSVPSSFPGRSW